MVHPIPQERVRRTIEQVVDVPISQVVPQVVGERAESDVGRARRGGGDTDSEDGRGGPFCASGAQPSTNRCVRFGGGARTFLFFGPPSVPQKRELEEYRWRFSMSLDVPSL